MSNQSYFTASSAGVGSLELRDNIEEGLGKARMRTPKHFTTGPQTFNLGSDIASFDTTAASITANLPATPLDGDTYEVVKTVAGNTLTIGRNGKTINGAAADTAITAAWAWAIFTWSAEANTWLLRN
jgi:hypothetical protein